jgi:hypothetical protein
MLTTAVSQYLGNYTSLTICNFWKYLSSIVCLTRLPKRLEVYISRSHSTLCGCQGCLINYGYSSQDTPLSHYMLGTVCTHQQVNHSPLLHLHLHLFSHKVGSHPALRMVEVYHQHRQILQKQC